MQTGTSCCRIRLRARLVTSAGNTITGPNVVGFDVNAIKRVRVSEGKEFELRVDVVNVLNHPNFANPTTNIDSTSFGQITSATGARRFTFNARLNF